MPESSLIASVIETARRDKIRLRVIHLSQFSLVITSAAHVKAIGIIPPALTPYGELVLGAAVALKPFILLLLDFMDDGVLNNSAK